MYKLIGPVLVKQDLAEANANVRKRIEYMTAELYAISLYPVPVAFIDSAGINLKTLLLCGQPNNLMLKFYISKS